MIDRSVCRKRAAADRVAALVATALVCTTGLVIPVAAATYRHAVSGRERLADVSWFKNACASELGAYAELERAIGSLGADRNVLGRVIDDARLRLIDCLLAAGDPAIDDGATDESEPIYWSIRR